MRQHPVGRRPVVTRIAAVVAAMGIVAGAAAVAVARPVGHAGIRKQMSPRSPEPVAHNPRGRFLGVLATAPGRQVPSAAVAGGTPPLTYHGGPVQHASTVYALFWVPKGTYMPAAYRTDVTQFLSDVASDSYGVGNVSSSDTQYYDTSGPGGSKNWVSYNVHYGGSYTTHDSLPPSGCSTYQLGDSTTTTACLTDAQLQAEISSQVTARRWPRGLGSEVFLFTPPSIGICFDGTGKDCYDAAAGGFCAYHSFMPGSTVTLYAAQPFAALTGCEYLTAHAPTPNGDAGDAAVNVVSHEANETMTDPLGTAWFDSSGYENGDECAWLGVSTSFNGYGDYDQTIHGDEYLLQYEWSNRANACVSRNTYPQPTASFTASAGPVHGTPVSFRSTVTDTDDTAFTYSWDFGDGGASAAASPSHTYATAGSYSVVLVVFDAHGDQVRTTKTVAVG